MKLFDRLFHNRRAINPVTEAERRKLANTMPGETGAIAAARMGFVVR